MAASWYLFFFMYRCPLSKYLTFPFSGSLEQPLKEATSTKTKPPTMQRLALRRCTLVFMFSILSSPQKNVLLARKSANTRFQHSGQRLEKRIFICTLQLLGNRKSSQGLACRQQQRPIMYVGLSARLRLANKLLRVYVCPTTARQQPLVFGNAAHVHGNIDAVHRSQRIFMVGVKANQQEQTPLRGQNPLQLGQNSILVFEIVERLHAKGLREEVVWKWNVLG